MSPQLQALIDKIQQDENISAEEKEFLLKGIKDADKAHTLTSFKLDRAEKDRHTLSVMLQETIDDLQKKSKAVEEKNHELEIESSLERVRSVAMGMKKPEDMLDICKTISNQLALLGIKEIRNIQTAIFYEEKGTYMNYQYYSKHDKTFITDTVYTNHEVGKDFAAKMIKGKGEFYITHITGRKEVDDWIAYQKSTNVFIDDYLHTASSLSYYWYSLGPVALGISTYHPLTEEEENLFKRFLTVFELSYRRYLDIEQAEAQAKEAQIEAALERVRARTMAMHKSSEVTAIAVSLNEELIKLGFEGGSSIIIMDKETGDTEQWTGFSEDKTLKSCFVPYFQHPYHDALFNNWKNGERFLVYAVAGIEKKSLDEHYFSTGYKEFPESDKRWMMQMRSVTFSLAFMKYGAIHWGPVHLTDDQLQILERFSKVFEQSYTRFLDLQKAEAQTREALIEGALERVRARALAMQQPEELKDVAQVMRNEMGALGVEELETSSIYIHGDSSDNVECWYALQDPKHTEKKMVTDHFILNLDDTWVGREMKKFYLSQEKQTSIVMQGTNRREWIEYCYKHSPAFSGFYGETIPDRTYHLYKFSHGYIGAAAPGDISAESWRLLSRAASVFSLAYSRFRDLTQARNDLIKLKEEKKRAEDALTELQATQKQLIQSEKMASLGELTAGIAHEIQNPLNFVNNFSDVSNELLEEMKEELQRGNKEDAMAIADDVKQNLEKILLHGKRADGIVKSMLQHSRTSSGKKEPTDINALCDEYLRLAFHGLRAKDKSFNAKFETHLDSSIQKINLVPQDIGRVILNLINNAFYAISERKKINENGYEPTVLVSTKKLNDKIEIKVKDNGTGIPQKVLDKIFQPFFTTKPTGQGTGLGLSLSYDIITKGHGGDLKVETKEGEGSEFIIQIPTN